MQQTFYKYQGTGNDFVMIDNRQQTFDKNNTKQVAFLCDRRFGIGADGLILLENHPDYDFKMVYYNADGNESSMCGNGGRCLVAFAQQLGVITNKAVFEAIDGLHHATIENGIVNLQMLDVDVVEKHDNHVFLNTGSPHHVQFEEKIQDFDIKTKGAGIRYGAPYNEAGTNVNFVQKVSDDLFRVRTYERGVEDETLSCGTGVTAVAIAMHATGETQSNKVTLNVEGGKLQVRFNVENGAYNDVWLIGPATYVFEGKI
ncbi:diaminopimelate epimerase [Tamlana sp. 2_MG-2023]|uniref:diaminopimelate epimerase n=1 Tax=unclassified Tamlana TaxID=2614803 RepID=UPI0026E3FBD2|nr:MULTISPECIES: diaminopimelate epimerase [unclassified Tamlana]MDO6759082.1 diaminopimelate epimerase [Tamlana sp. 2_MG-2023]MDO6789781.1 diaminopimelate epimerase [Tamlana sp. 1_MG-2023]